MLSGLFLVVVLRHVNNKLNPHEDDMAAQVLLSVLACVTAVSEPVAAQERATVLRKIRESHAKIRDHVFTNVAVEVRCRNIRLPKGTVELETTKGFVIRGEERMMRDGKDVLASNADYRFRVNDRQTGRQIGYLEGKRHRNATAEAFEDRLGLTLRLSMSLDILPLVEVLEDRAFVVDSIREGGGATTITGRWEHGDETFYDITIRLDPNNLYQVLASTYTVRRPKYTIRVTRNYTYASKPFDGSTIRLPATFEQEIVELVDDAPKGDVVREEAVYTGWERAPNDPAIFRLSGYGFREPDLDALNGSRSLFRLAVCISVGIVGALLILFGRRLFPASTARAPEPSMAGLETRSSANCSCRGDVRPD